MDCRTKSKVSFGIVPSEWRERNSTVQFCNARVERELVPAESANRAAAGSAAEDKVAARKSRQRHQQIDGSGRQRQRVLAGVLRARGRQ